MDDSISIPGTQIKLGFDALIGLIPGAGDGASALVSLYLVWQSWRIGASKRALSKMLLTLGIDFVLGIVPILGDIFDVAWKANIRNLEILEKDLQRFDQP